MKQISLLVSVACYDDFDITRVGKEGELVLWGIARATMMRSTSVVVVVVVSRAGSTGGDGGGSSRTGRDLGVRDHWYQDVCC
jgi:hypothetical protein